VRPSTAGATQSVGSSPTDPSLRFQKDQQSGKFPPASRFFFMPGMAPPGGGPDAVLRVGTTALNAIYEISTAEAARAAVQAMARKNINSVKIWVDDRRGTYPKMTPEVYTAIIDEAHKHRMTVNAHATTLPDQKAVVKAGADVLVHMVQNELLDDELAPGRKPPGRRPARRSHRSATTILRSAAHSWSPDRAMTEASVIRAVGRRLERSQARRSTRQQKMMINRGHTFGTGDHHEIARWVQLSPGTRRRPRGRPHCSASRTWERSQWGRAPISWC
jgi:hypothetical protein